MDDAVMKWAKLGPGPSVGLIGADSGAVTFASLMSINVAAIILLIRLSCCSSPRARANAAQALLVAMHPHVHVQIVRVNKLVHAEQRWG